MLCSIRVLLELTVVIVVASVAWLYIRSILLRRLKALICRKRASSPSQSSADPALRYLAGADPSLVKSASQE